jgi:DNA-binding transcriptional ArsR family regulator
VARHRIPSSVGELAAQLPVSRPAVSQHLRALKDGGLVVSRPAGTRHTIVIRGGGWAAILELFAKAVANQA